MVAAVRRRAGPALRDALLWTLSLPWVALGLVAGLLVSLALWIVACLLAGYRAGRFKD
jgi:hypothetical protein